MSSQNNYNTEVYCTLQFEGIHCWPDCPIEEVAYLRSPHRHIFHVKAYKVVHHDDRDVEFIWLKHRIQDYIDGTFKKSEFTTSAVYDLGPVSCEMIAKMLVDEFELSSCEVSEDLENGARVTVTKPITQ